MESMGEFVLILSRLGVGALGTFLAVLLWSHTRDVSWVLVIIGTLVAYAEVVIATLERFGLIGSDLFVVAGFPVLRIVLANLPMILFSGAFISMLSRRRLR